MNAIRALCPTVLAAIVATGIRLATVIGDEDSEHSDAPSPEDSSCLPVSGAETTGCESIAPEDDGTFESSLTQASPEFKSAPRQYLPDLDLLRRKATDPAYEEWVRADALWLVKLYYPDTNDYALILTAAEFVRNRYCEETTHRACLFLEGVQELVAIEALAQCYRQNHWKFVLDAAERALRAVEDWPVAREALGQRWTPREDPPREEEIDN